MKRKNNEDTYFIMAKHNNLGKAGEAAAAIYLEKNGYTIRHRNWREQHLELDIVATKDDCLIVVEVKTRTTDEWQAPEEAVTKQKIRHILHATDAYIKTFGIDMPVRFDIVTAIGSEKDFQIEHFQDAFFSSY